MKIFSVIMFFLLLLSACDNDYDFVIRDNRAASLKTDARLPFPPRLSSSLRQPASDTSLYSDTAKRINVEAGQSGLPPEVRRVYITLFSAPPSLLLIQQDIDRRLRIALEQSGLDVVDRIPDAQAIINGRIKDFSIQNGENVTNLSASLLYSMELEINVENRIDTSGNDGEFHEVEDKILVVNTNQYLSNDVIPMLLDNSVRYLSEVILYGWQTEYFKKKDESYQILGEKDESSDTTNRP